LACTPSSESQLYLKENKMRTITTEKIEEIYNDYYNELEDLESALMDKNEIAMIKSRKSGIVQLYIRIMGGSK
jgi:hypothetical protein